MDVDLTETIYRDRLIGASADDARGRRKEVDLALFARIMCVPVPALRPYNRETA